MQSNEFFTNFTPKILQTYYPFCPNQIATPALRSRFHYPHLSQRDHEDHSNRRLVPAELYFWFHRRSRLWASGAHSDLRWRIGEQFFHERLQLKECSLYHRSIF